MVDEDEVEQTPHGGTKIRARAPERRPEVRFEPASADEPEDRPLTGGVDPAHARAGLPSEGPARPPVPPTDATVEASDPDVPIVDARAVAKRLRERTRKLLDRARAADPSPADPAQASLERPPAPPTDATTQASDPDVPLVDARAITDRFRERTRGLVDRVRSIEPPPAIVSRDGEEELDERATERPPVPPMEAGEAAGPTRPTVDGEPTEPSAEGFRVLRFGPPPPAEDAEPVPEEDGPPAVEPPGGELDRPPAPPTSIPVSATPIEVADQAHDEADETTSLLGRLRDSLPGGGDDEKPAEHEDEPPETGGEPEPDDEPAADHLERPPAPPTATRDQESMVAVPDKDQDDPDETSEGTSGFLSRMKDRFSRDDEEEPEPDREAEPSDEPEEEAEEEPAEADDAEDDGFFSRMRDRFSSDGEDEAADDEAEEDEGPEADEHEEEPIPEPPEDAEEPDQPPETPDEVEGDEEPEEEPPVPEPALAADGDEGDPVPARPETDDADEPDEGEAPTEDEQPARPERTVDPGQAQPNGSAGGPPEPGPAGGDPVPARPTGTPTDPADESAIDADELHETVDEVLERYRQPPPRLLREPRRR